MRQLFFIYLLLVLGMPGAHAEPELKVLDKFSSESQAGDTIRGWTEKSFVGHTDYSVVEEDGNSVLRARAGATASGLYKEIKYDLEEYPYLSWRWKVTRLPKDGDVRFKETDDYGARVYVVFPRFLKWRTKTINHIWDRTLPEGESVPNPWLPKNAVMVVAESGSDSLGRWVTEKHNVYQDYQKVFGGKPPKVGPVAIMTDADNTGGSAEAYYDDLIISDE
jgi:hypothetical protein